MSKKTPKNEQIRFYPVTKSRWESFEKLFGERGACGGCWCMWWRVQKKEFEKKRGVGNKTVMQKMINSGKVPGVIAYDFGKPMGWCSVAPRKDYPRLEKSRILKPIDDKSVWSIVCLFINKEYRKKGFSSKLLRAACDYAGKRGAKIVEGYPSDIKNKLPDAFVYNGLMSSYAKAGFKEVLRRSKTRPIMRFSVKK